MLDPIQRYLSHLKMDLEGHVPPEALTNILEESETHLRDLASELGSQHAAIARFGNGRRFSRKMIREHNFAPNVWRASVLPLVPALVITSVLTFGPTRFIGSWAAVSEVDFFSLERVTAAGTLIFFLGCFLARQILVLPLIAFSLLQVVLVTIDYTNLAIPVPLAGFRARSIPREDGLRNFDISVDKEIQAREKDLLWLRNGVVIFGRNLSAKDVPSAYLFGGSYGNPRLVTWLLNERDHTDDLHFSLCPNLFASFGRDTGAYDSNLAAAKNSWQRDGLLAVVRVNQEIQNLRATELAAPAAMHRPILFQLGLTFLETWKSSALTMAKMLQLNLYAWLAWKLFVYLRRRYASRHASKTMFEVFI